MSATSAKKTSYRLFKVAAELNIGKETLVEFLQSKGFEIPPKPTAVLSQEMYDLVMGKFEKEHRQATKQRKKLDAYHERRTKLRETLTGPGKKQAEEEEEPKVEEQTEATPEAAEPQTEPDRPETVEAEETRKPEAEEETPEEKEVAATEEEIPVQEPEAEAETEAQEQQQVEAEAPPVEEPETTTPVETAQESVEEQPPVESTTEEELHVVDQEEPAGQTADQQEVEAETAQEAEAELTEKNRVETSAPVEEPVKAETEPSESTAEETKPEVTEESTETEPETASTEPEEENITDTDVLEEPTTATAEMETLEPPVKEDQEKVVSERRRKGPHPGKEGKGKAKKPEVQEEQKEVGAEGEDLNTISKRPKLQGLTVLGKIEIGKEKEGKKKDDKKRRKRKRIRESKSIDIEAEARKGKTATAKKEREEKPSRRKRKRGVQVNQEDVARAIKQTFSRMEDSTGSARQKRSRQKRATREARSAQQMEEMAANRQVLRVTEFVTVADLANLMDVEVTEVIGKCIGLGLMVSINQRLDQDTIQLVADEFGFSVEFMADYAEDLLADEEDPVETLKPRAPIVTIMGHVDHGKTSLLDYIRNANVVAGEAGGITQHIGAYSVELDDGREVTFLDTPGHEAFTAMRARGAQVTDIVILIVAADDAVMPQTVEAISHAQAAGVPIVVAINKVDKPDSNPEKIKQQLADRGILVESWGGKYQAIEISAKAGTNIDKLLDAILLEAEILDLKANPDRLARGVIVEAEIDRGKGVVATVLVQKGRLRVGDPIIAGRYSGRVRALLDERGHRLEVVGPSEPAQVLGLGGVPTSGDVLVSVDTEQDARDIAQRRQQLHREQEFKQVRRITLDDISDQIAMGGVQDLPLIIKGDVDGSVEALADALQRLSTPEVQVSVIMKSVGEITESDVLLAAASNAIIIGFHVRPNLKARKLAEQEGVDVRTYQIIYDTVNEVRAALEGMLAPEQKEVITGTVEVREIFKISKVGTIAGCYVQDGKITRSDQIRLLRDGLEIYTGSISSLKRIKDDVREVEQGFECGITLENMNDIKQGDVIEAYKMVEIKRKLEAAPAQ